MAVWWPNVRHSKFVSNDFHPVPESRMKIARKWSVSIRNWHAELFRYGDFTFSFSPSLVSERGKEHRTMVMMIWHDGTTSIALVLWPHCVSCVPYTDEIICVKFSSIDFNTQPILPMCCNLHYRTIILYSFLLCFWWSLNCQRTEQCHFLMDVSCLLPTVSAIFLQHQLTLTSFVPLSFPTRHVPLSPIIMIIAQNGLHRELHWWVVLLLLPFGIRFAHQHTQKKPVPPTKLISGDSNFLFKVTSGSFPFVFD